MLWLPGADGTNAWQDHVSYVVLRDEWPARPYPPSRGRRVVVLVNGVPGSGTTTLARQLSAELQVPLFSKDVLKKGVADALWALLSDSPVGGVVEGWFRPDDAPSVGQGIRRAGLDPATVPELWCDSARALGQTPAGPLGLGPTVVVDTSHEAGRGEVVRIALQVGDGLSPASDV